MKSLGVFKHFLIAFLCALVLYIVFYNFIEGGRTRKGPWRVAFSSPGGDSPPVLIINEPKLNISNLRITFPGQTARQTNAVIIFDHPQETPFDLPFGQCIFMDVITQPGTATFRLFGHEIQLLPRVLTIDKKEQPWRSDTTIQVTTKIQ